MSGSINYARLLGGLSGAGNALLGTIYGFNNAGAGSTIRTDPFLALQQAEKNRTRDVAATAREPEIQRDIRAFKAAIAKATTPAQALANPAVLKVLLTANGLADQIPYRALATRILLSDPTDKKSLVNTLGNAKWKTAVETFSFATKGLDVLKAAGVQATVADSFAEVSWRKALEKLTPGLSDALDFRKRAATFTSAIQILGDNVLRRVVTTALGIPKEIAFQELPAQERAITTRLDISRLQNSKFVDAFSHRYLLAAQKNSNANATPDLNALAVQSRSIFV